MSRPARFKDLTEMKAAISITDNTKEMSTKATPSLRITSELYDVKLTLRLFKSHLKCHNSLGLTLHYVFWITLPPHPPKRELGARVSPAPNSLDMVNTDPTGKGWAPACPCSILDLLQSREIWSHALGQTQTMEKSLHSQINWICFWKKKIKKSWTLPNYSLS